MNEEDEDETFHLFENFSTTNDRQSNDSDSDSADIPRISSLISLATNTVEAHSRRMSIDQRLSFNQDIKQATAKHNVQKERKRRGSVQYYQDIQTQLQQGLQHLSLEKQETLGILLDVKIKEERTKETTELMNTIDTTTKITSLAAAKKPILTTTTTTKLSSSTLQVPFINESSSKTPKLTLQPMRFGSNPLENIRPTPIVSDPSPIPKHFTALKKLTAQNKEPSSLLLSSTSTATATTSSTINFSNPRQRPQSARRVPRQRHSQTSSKKRVRVPSRLRPYLNAIPNKNSTCRKKGKRKNKQKRNKKTSNTWSSSKKHASLKKYLSLSKDQWNTIIASGLDNRQSQKNIYGVSFLTEAEQKQLQLSQSLNVLGSPSSSSSPHCTDKKVDHAWKELKYRIASELDEYQDENEEYETFICTRKRDQLLLSIDMFENKSSPSTAIIFEAHGAARRSIHSSAYVLQKWWKSMLYYDYSNEDNIKPWDWHDDLKLKKRRNRLQKRLEIMQKEEYRTNRETSRDPRTMPTGKYLRMGGGRFSEGEPNSYLDWELLRVQDHPGPGAYTPVLPPSILGAAKISEARPNSYLDWEVLRGQDIPGPAAYNIFLSG